MAISKILPWKTMRNRTRKRYMVYRLGYDKKPKKTKNSKQIPSYMCVYEIAVEEFEISKQLYAQLTGRTQPPTQRCLT